MNLPDDVRRRLEERGIDPERAVEEFLAEVRVEPPPRLLRDLGLAPILNRAEVYELGQRGPIPRKWRWKHAA